MGDELAEIGEGVADPAEIGERVVDPAAIDGAVADPMGIAVRDDAAHFDVLVIAVTRSPFHPPGPRRARRRPPAAHLSGEGPSKRHRRPVEAKEAASRAQVRAPLPVPQSRTPAPPAATPPATTPPAATPVAATPPTTTPPATTPVATALRRCRQARSRPPPGSRRSQSHAERSQHSQTRQAASRGRPLVAAGRGGYARPTRAQRAPGTPSRRRTQSGGRS